ncbi:TPA: hypothetical protein ACGO8F_001404 [Streptococcus suis]
MNRPRRYPYSKGQWEIKEVIGYFGEDLHIVVTILKNGITGETKSGSTERKESI